MGQSFNNMDICGEPPIEKFVINIPFLCGFSHSTRPFPVHLIGSVWPNVYGKDLARATSCNDSGDNLGNNLVHGNEVAPKGWYVLVA